MTDSALFSAERFVGYMALGFGTGFYGTLIGTGGGFYPDAHIAFAFPKGKPRSTHFHISGSSIL
jgi:hypothetical protein